MCIEMPKIKKNTLSCLIKFNIKILLPNSIQILSFDYLIFLYIYKHFITTIFNNYFMSIESFQRVECMLINVYYTTTILYKFIYQNESITLYCISTYIYIYNESTTFYCISMNGKIINC